MKCIVFAGEKKNEQTQKHVVIRAVVLSAKLHVLLLVSVYSHYNLMKVWTEG